MPPKKSLQLALAADLTPFIGDGELVALNVGADGQLYAVVALKDLDYRTGGDGVSFAKIKTETPQVYRVIALHEGCATLDAQIINEPFNIHDVQPLPKNRLLLVCCRSRYRGRNDFDKNRRIYSNDGQMVREILLGDGIQSVQATTEGIIWTSFFDEGVFGNFGWTNPIGASGLVAWDAKGTKLNEFQPTDGLDSICDCYALNVESKSSTWLYYYTEFPLVHLRDHKVQSHWSIPKDGSSAFAVAHGYALFNGGYNRRNDYTLYELGHSHRVNEVVTFTFADDDGKPLVADFAIGRADSLYVRRKNQVYRLDVQMALQL